MVSSPTRPYSISRSQSSIPSIPRPACRPSSFSSPVLLHRGHVSRPLPCWTKRASGGREGISQSQWEVLGAHGDLRVSEHGRESNAGYPPPPGGRGFASCGTDIYLQDWMDESTIPESTSKIPSEPASPSPPAEPAAGPLISGYIISLQLPFAFAVALAVLPGPHSAEGSLHVQTYKWYPRTLRWSLARTGTPCTEAHPTHQPFPASPLLTACLASTSPRASPQFRLCCLSPPRLLVFRLWINPFCPKSNDDLDLRILHLLLQCEVPGVLTILCCLFRGCLLAVRLLPLTDSSISRSASSRLLRTTNTLSTAPPTVPAVL